MPFPNLSTELSAAGQPAAKITGRKLFTFAVVADTHLEPEEGSLPRSNRRTRAVIAQLRKDAPAFVLHLGDLVHPVPALPGFTGAAQAVRDAFGALDCPVYMTPGNHDIGDKRLPWMPAKSVTSEWIEGYRGWFGAPFQAFSHAGCRFVLVNTPAFNSGLPFEAEQRDWLQAELAQAEGRLFVATHYPPYLLQPGEPSSYDNLDEPARSWFLNLLEQHRAEALFVGHVHNFFYTLHERPGGAAKAPADGMDFYALPSTSFVRRDYSELFRIAPDATQEYGRNDAGKLGYFLVDVHERGHLARPMRGGEGLPGAGRSVRGLHPVEAPQRGLGAHLRHPWGEVVALPHNPPTDEFQRRRVRNDYTLLSCWELGLRNLRVPLADLADLEQRWQMAAGARLGLRFTVFSADLPTARQTALVAEHRGLLARWELILPWDAPAQLVAPLQAVRAEAGVPLLVGRLRTAGADLGGGSNLKHFTWAGFMAAEAEALATWLTGFDKAQPAVDALLLRVPWEEDALEALPGMASLAADLGVEAMATVCLAPEDPSAANVDDAAIACRVAGAQFLGATLGATLGGAPDATAGANPDGGLGLPLFLDTFADIDRGYFVRNGLVDRQFNPRAAGWVFRHQQRVLAALPALRFAKQHRAEGLAVLQAASPGAVAALLLPEQAEAALPRLPDLLEPLAAGPLMFVNLQSGEVSALALGEAGGLVRPLPVAQPALLLGGAATQALDD